MINVVAEIHSVTTEPELEDDHKTGEVACGVGGSAVLRCVLDQLKLRGDMRRINATSTLSLSGSSLNLIIILAISPRFKIKGQL